MSILKRGQAASQIGEEQAEIAREAARSSGSHMATIISLFALVFSGISFYETVFKQAALRVFVPPVIQYSDPARGPFELFNIPITLSNSGARLGTVLSMELKVTNLKTKQSKRYYSAAIGRWADRSKGALPAYAPLSVAGKSSYSGELLFYTRKGEAVERIIDQEGGAYQFELSLNTTQGKGAGLLDRFLQSEVKPITFTMEITSLDYRNFSNGGTMPLYSKDFQAAVSKP